MKLVIERIVMTINGSTVEATMNKGHVVIGRATRELQPEERTAVESAFIKASTVINQYN